MTGPRVATELAQDRLHVADKMDFRDRRVFDRDRQFCFQAAHRNRHLPAALLLGVNVARFINFKVRRFGFQHRLIRHVEPLAGSRFAENQHAALVAAVIQSQRRRLNFERTNGRQRRPGRRPVLVRRGPFRGPPVGKAGRQGQRKAKCNPTVHKHNPFPQRHWFSTRWRPKIFCRKYFFCDAP